MHSEWGWRRTGRRRFSAAGLGEGRCHLNQCEISEEDTQRTGELGHLCKLRLCKLTGSTVTASAQEVEGVHRIFLCVCVNATWLRLC